MGRLGDVEFAVQDRIAGGVFVDVGGAVADPLARDKDGQFDVELDLAHLEGGGVPVAHQVADQPFVVLHRFRAAPIADAGRLTDRRIVAHIVDDAHKAVVEHGNGLVEMGLHPFGDGAQGLFRLCPQSVDFGLLVGADRHGGRPVIWAWIRGLLYLRQQATGTAICGIVFG